MRNSFVAVLAASLLTGCGEIALITAPIWVPIEYGVSQSKVVQPVTVLSPSGAQITPPTEDAAEATFQVTNATIVCQGRHRIGESSQNGVALSCNKGLKGRVNFRRFTTREAIISIGPASAPEIRIGTLGVVRFQCTGNYNASAEGFDAFLLECPERGAAVLGQVSTEQDPEAFTVWIHPPT